jgi:[ribosomal protein S5]-alanine N-acetyltransferase
MIQTQRLNILPWQEDQAQAFLELTQDEGFNLFPITIYRQASLDSARQWILEALALNQQTSLGKWAVWEKSSGALLGMGGLTPWQHENEHMIDITYRLRQSAWGSGLGLELAHALVQFGFNNLHLTEITATITPDNLASQRIAEKIGMKRDKRIILLGVETDLYRLQRG